MVLTKLRIRNFKLFRDMTLEMNENTNVFVGANDAGKTTLLEALSLVTSCKLHGSTFDQKQLRLSLFNQSVRTDFCNAVASNYHSAMSNLPEIVIEAYCRDDDDCAEYKGRNNDLRENCPGVRLLVAFDQTYETIYRDLLEKREIKDIPIEFYKVTFNYFSGEPVLSRRMPFKMVFVDTTHHDYSQAVNRFVSGSVDTMLSEEEVKVLTAAYRHHKKLFSDDAPVRQLNDKLKSGVRVREKPVTVTVAAGAMEEWRRQLALMVGEDAFDTLGYGTQNSVKIELALRAEENDVTTVLMEEPENNLAFSKLTELLGCIGSQDSRQIFLTTHCSYVANNLGLNNVHFINGNKVISFSAIEDRTRRYFQKLPSYDTLRFVLAEKVVLVEGPTDALLVKHAYRNIKKAEIASAGVDVIAVGALSFRRYLVLAGFLKKTVWVLTDNDRSAAINVDQKYGEYVTQSEGRIKVYTERNDSLNTIEPSVLEVNSVTQGELETFQHAIRRSKLAGKNKEETLEWMLKNKVEWALNLSESSEVINYPKHINELIREIG